MVGIEKRISEIGQWHERAFPWADVRDIASKLREEAEELFNAATRDEIEEELADCAICIFAVAARAGIDIDEAIAEKLPSVMRKYSGEKRPE